jgi:hypothetical protein
VRDAALHIHHVVVAELVELAGADAGLDEGRDVIEDFRAETARDAHFFDFFGRFDRDAHGCCFGALGHLG